MQAVGCHTALCHTSMPSLSLSLPSVASTPTAAVSAGRPPSRASASESWDPGNYFLHPPQLSHLRQQALTSLQTRHEIRKEEEAHGDQTEHFEEMLRK